MALNSKCPTCGAGSNKPEIGRDGSPRKMEARLNPLTDEKETVRRRERAYRIAAQNRARGKR